MNLTTIDQWEGAIEIIVRHKKELAAACEAAEMTGTLNHNGPLARAIWDTLDDLVKLIDRDGWIDWFIWDNKCGEYAAQYRDKSGELIKITTARQVAEFIVESIEEEQSACREMLRRCEMWLSTHPEGRAMQLECQRILSSQDEKTSPA